MSAALKLYRRFGSSALGRWFVSRLICFKAPYFRSIAPTLQRLEPGVCAAVISHRWRVQNHIGTVHAIALCNLAEFCAGLATDAAMTPGIRWIPKGMTVRYLKKANGRMLGQATLEPIGEVGAGADRQVAVSVTDPSGTEVFSATVTMYISPSRTS
jgi:acyl-coenzyme A thioesterase PaaI-like protein